MRKRRRRISTPKFQLSPDIKRDIFVILIFAIAFINILAMFNLAGAVGNSINNFWQMIFGWGWWIWPFLMILIGYLIINIEKLEISATKWIGLIIFELTFSGLLHLFVRIQNFDMAKAGEGGGILGYLVGMPLESVAGFWGSLIILLSLLLISILLFFESSFREILDKFHWPSLKNLKEKFSPNYSGQDDDYTDTDDIGFEQKEIDPEYAGEEGEEEIVEYNDGRKKTKQQTRKLYPHIDIPLDLLNGKPGKPTSGDIKSNSEIIRKTLKHFGIDVDMTNVSIGPTVTQYAFKPASGVKVSQITTLSNDLALALAAHPIRIEAPIPGKSLIGVEVPNQKIAVVTLKEILASEKFKFRESKLMTTLGKDVAGNVHLADLDKMPHLLVAGATGSGKTVCLNSIIVSLLFQNQPDELKFILIDPKQVEMTQYNNVPHLICPVITDIKKTINALRWAVVEMERRFNTLSKSGKRNISAYNATRPKEKMPYLIIVVDELADLMSTAAAEIEQAIIRLAQKSRAVGIHLILATQRPSVNVITGLIKANITSRIAFSVASSQDSRTILDFSGAEKLLGRGDMLFISAELSKPIRIQGAFLADHEIDKVVNYLKQKAKPDYIEEVTEKISSVNAPAGINLSFGFGNDDDDLLPEAKEIVISVGKASSSYLQRRLRIGYSRAARLLDLLEKQGVVGSADGSKPREVLIKSEEDMEDSEQDQELNKLEQANQELKEYEEDIQE
ncbi:DNA translocase FtsK [Patescibacteria group bacterium]|nr:DNA translocase FtsK [Patescibacteria group bacterium]